MRALCARERARLVRFGLFELDLRTGELRKRGVRIARQEQPFQVLAMLVARPGDLVPREALRAALWPDAVFVDFDHGLNKAVGKIRRALGDLADSPRFVETLERRGYRFIATVERVEEASTPQTLFKMTGVAWNFLFDTHDGKPFVMVVPSERDPSPLTIVVNWTPPRR